jgi:hypothetical protein
LENENVGIINNKVNGNDNTEKCFVFLAVKSLFDMEFSISK